jgi:hypothetical protein
MLFKAEEGASPLRNHILKLPVRLLMKRLVGTQTGSKQTSAGAPKAAGAPIPELKLEVIG